MKAKNGKFYYPKRRQQRQRKPTTKQLVLARQPIIETKKNQAGQSTFDLSRTSSAQFVALRSFIDMSQGSSSSDMIGESIFSKFIKMKLRFRFPRDEYAIRKNYRIQLIHGWMTAPFALATTPVGAPYAPARGTVSPTELEQIIVARLQDAFNSEGDEMAFRDKEKRIYKVLGKKWLKVDRTGALGFPQMFGRYAAETDHLLGGIPDIKESITWRPMRKVKYTYSNPSGSSEYWFPNESWVPFVCLYIPEYGNTAAAGAGQSQSDFQPKCTVNDCHWYSDS
jgi:hypothetical protein